MSASMVDTARGVYLPLEVRQFDGLYTPIKTSLRIKYSCFAVSNHLIVLGANTGAVYVFVKHPLNYISFIPNKERDIQIIRFSPDGRCIAIGTGSGAVIVWELNVSHLQSSKKMIEISEHKGSLISDMIWDNKGQQLFIGDSNGKISTAHMPGVLPRTVLSAAGGIGLRKPGIILICETPVVQLDYDNDHLLVSCKHKSAIMNLKREEVTYVGSQERDGLFGACFYRDTQSIPNHTLILSARPKARIWKASLDGKVQLTYKLKDLLQGVNITPIYGVRLKPKSERPEEEVPGDQNIPNVLRRIRVINNKITQHSLVKDIQELHVLENDIWISQGDPVQIRCLSLLHYTQLFKSLSQLQLHSQVTEVLLEFGENLIGEGTDATPECVQQDTQHPRDVTAEPNVDKQLHNAGATQQKLSSQPAESHATNTSDEQVTQASTPLVSTEVKPGTACKPGDEDSRLLETEIHSVTDTHELNAISDTVLQNEFVKESKSLPVEMDREPLSLEEVESVVQQSTEQEAVYSLGIVSNSFDENSLPFPKVSRIRKTQSLKEGDISSSPKLVRKRSKKGASSSSAAKEGLSRSGSENELVSKPTPELDTFATDIFQDTVITTYRRKSDQLDDSPISEHIPRSERKKKQKKRESKSEITPLQSSNQPGPVVTHETISLSHDSVAAIKDNDSIDMSTNENMFEEFILNSHKNFEMIESSEDDPSSSFPFISSWLSSFISLIASVPPSSLPGSHTISTLSQLSASTSFPTLQQLAISAMLSGCWQSLSFPNPLSLTTKSEPCNFFYLQALFLPISEVRAYLTTTLHQLDRRNAYFLYIKGLQDFKETTGDLPSATFDIDSQTFPTEFLRNLKNGIEFCIDKFPSVLPWEISTILFGSIDSLQELQHHLNSQLFTEYMERLFSSADSLEANSNLLATVFSTDHDSFLTWCCLSLSLLPSSTRLSIKNNLCIPKPDSHLLKWKYKHVWELILKRDIISSGLATKCLPHFKQHCFWTGILYCYFVLEQREEATTLLLQLRDKSLIGQHNQPWGKYPRSIPDWRLTVEIFLSLFDGEFSAASREETGERIADILRLAVRDIGCLSVVELLRDILPSLERNTNIKVWFPYDLLLKFIQIVNMDKERSKIASHLLERLDEELWKRKPNAISLQFLLQENNGESKDRSTIETSGFQWGIRAKQNEFICQSCCTEFTLPLPVLPSDIQVFACGHSYHKACLAEGACTLCFSEHLT